MRAEKPDRSRVEPPRWLVPTLFALVALLLVVPALPGLPWSLAAEDVLFFRAPFGGMKPADLVAPGNTLLLDPVEVFHPDLEWFRSSLLNGSLPMWNPFAGAGWPVVHSQQTAPFYPLNWPALALPLWDATGLVAALHVAVAATGTYLFTRRSLGLLPLPAALAAVAYGCSSYFVAWLEHPHDNVYALLPFTLLAVDLVIRRQTVRSAALLAAVLGLDILGGHPQSIVITGIPVLAFAVARLAGAQARGRALLMLVLGGVAGLLAGAVMVVPFLEILGQASSTSRGGIAGLEPRTLLSLALPDRWGRPDWAHQDASLFGKQNYFERTLYIGAPALMLAAGGLAARRVRDQWLFAALAAVGLLLALDLPGVTWFVINVPPFSNVTMIRALVIAAFALAVLAGFGLQRWLEGDPAERRRVLVAAGVVAALPLVWLALHPSALGDVPDAAGTFGERETAIRSGATAAAAAALRWTLVAAAALALLFVAWRRPALSAATAIAIVAVQAADLVQQGRDVHPVVPERHAEVSSTPALEAARTTAGSGRVLGEGSFLAPNLATRFGLRDARIREQPHLRRYWNVWLGYTRGAGNPIGFLAAQSGSGRVMDAFGVAAYMNPPGNPAPPLPELELRYTGPDGSVYANPTALPRAYVATTWRQATGEDEGVALSVASSTTELRRAPVVEGAPEPASMSNAPGSAEITVDGANRVEIDVSSPRPGRLVLLDGYFPGWQATVDGRDVPILATNGTFRSVAVAAGDSRVVFSYRPVSLAVGAAVSTIAWLAIGAALMAGVAAQLASRRRRPLGKARPAAASATEPPPR